MGSGSDAEGSNLLMLARTARENVSAGTALHAGTRAKMASKARSFRLSGDLQESKSSWTPPRLATQADISPARAISALPPKADICEECPLRAKSGNCVLGRSLSMRLLDYVSNFVLWTYKYDLIFSDKEFISFYFRHFFHYEGLKFLQSNIG